VLLTIKGYTIPAKIGDGLGKELYNLVIPSPNHASSLSPPSKFEYVP
jgi:hypothetical protein